MGKLMHFSWKDWLPFRNWRIIGRVDSADEVPTRLPRNGIVLVGTLEAPKWLAFDCPCKMRHRILLNLDKNRKPTWHIAKVAPFSLKPSVDYRDGKQRCHYVLRNGKTEWARNK